MTCCTCRNVGSVCLCVSAHACLPEHHGVTPRSFVCSNVSFAHAAISCRGVSCVDDFFKTRWLEAVI